MVKLDLRPLEVQGLEIISQYLARVGEAYLLNRLFRGHARREWMAVPSAFRPGVDGIKTHSQLDGWKAMSARFVSPQPNTNLGYLILAQHYGVPTGLLDWTANPLVALFFACEPTEDDVADGEVIQIDHTDFAVIRNFETVSTFAESRPQPLVLDTSASNIRSTAQESVMTLHTPDEAALAVQSVFVIPDLQKMAIRIALKLFGLTKERIYADLTLAATAFKQDLTHQREWDEWENGYRSEP